MGFDPLKSIKDSVQKAVSGVGNFFDDPLGAFEDVFNASLNIATLGQFGYLKDQIRGLFEIDLPFQDRTNQVRAPAGARQIIYGRALVGGQLVYIESWFDDRRYLTMTVVVAAHEVEEITSVRANGTVVATWGGANGLMTRVDDGKYNEAGKLRISCYAADGSQTSAIIPEFPPGSGQSAPNWTAAHVLRGQAYVHITLSYRPEVFESGIPKFEIEVKGKNDIYDPRTMTSGYTDNQALCTLDALRWSRMFDIPDSDIDMDSFAAAADVADEQVADGVGTTEKRYTVNGTVPFDRPPLEVLSSLARAGAGFPVYSQGFWSYVPGSYTAPVMSLDESQLVGGLSFQPGPGKKARHNKATGTYVDAAQDFEVVEFSQLIIQAYINDDLEELEKSFEFAMTNSGTMARRLAKIEIERGRFGLSVSLVAKFKALRLTPGDRINLTVERLGWTPKVFRVESTTFDLQSGVQLSLREDAPEIYEWEEGDVLELDAPPAIQIPEALDISPPENVTVAEELYSTLTRSAVKVRMIVSWDEDPDRVAFAYDVQFRQTGASVWVDAATFWQDNTVDINDVDDVEHEVRVRAINSLGQRSDWAMVTYDVIGKSAPPPDVSLLFIEKRILKWTLPNPPLDLAGYFVRFHDGTRTSWVDGTPAHEGIVTETIFDVSEFAGQKVFMVKAVDTTGNVSQNHAILTQNLGDPIVDNVIVTQNEAPGWTGTITGGFVNVSDQLEANQLGTFYGDGGSVFYANNGSTLFYEDEYERLTYEYTFTVAAADEGAELTVIFDKATTFDSRLDYTPPGFTGGFIAFPGNIESEAGTYTFKMITPQQQLGAAPQFNDIVTRLDVEDVIERLSDVAIAAGGTRLPITKTYRDILNVSLTVQDDGGTAVTARVLDKDEINGPLVQCFDSAGTATAGTVDATAQGF